MKNFEIKTKNLGFRRITLDDISYLEKLYKDPDVIQYLTDKNAQLQKILHAATNNEKKGVPSFLIFAVANNEFVGRAGFSILDNDEIEVTYELQKKFWGQGYATEALSALLHWAEKHIDADYIIAYTRSEHHASQRVLQKSGMEHYKDERNKDEDCRFYRKKLK